MNISAGEVVFMRGFTRVGRSPVVESAMKFRKVKGQREAFLFLGMVPDAVYDKEGFNPEKVLNAMGWKFVGDTEDSPLDTPVSTAPLAHESIHGHAASDVIPSTENEA